MQHSLIVVVTLSVYRITSWYHLRGWLRGLVLRGLRGIISQTRIGLGNGSSTRFLRACELIGSLLCSPVAGHPKTTKAAVFDIITQDLSSGSTAAGGEIVSVLNDILNTFPYLSESYEIHVSHSKSELSVLTFSSCGILMHN